MLSAIILSIVMVTYILHCHAKCRFFITMLIVVMLSTLMLSVRFFNVMLSAIRLGPIVLSVTFFIAIECFYAKCHCDKCHSLHCYVSWCHFSCHYAKCHIFKCYTFMITNMLWLLIYTSMNTFILALVLQNILDTLSDILVKCLCFALIKIEFVSIFPTKPHLASSPQSVVYTFSIKNALVSFN